jgi:2-hydroxy-3-keto-5-methylthiopentenyl-1-phosphate phosphatase
MMIVPQNDIRFGLEDRVNARYTALHLFGFDRRKCIRQINEPSNYIPYYEDNVTGLNKLQNKFYDVFATMNKDIPEPRP